MLALSLLALWWVTGRGFSEAQQDAMYNCPQAGKWAISVWSGPNDVDTETALATCPEMPVTAAYWLDPDAQQWLRYFQGRPDITNLLTVDNLQGLLALGGAGAPTPTSTPPGGDVFLYSRFIPPVVYSDGSSTTTLEVHTTGQGIEAIYLESGSVSYGQLYDDGSHGDQTAGDGVYTLSGITYPTPTWLWWDTFSTFGFEARIVGVGGWEERQSLAALGVVSPGLSYPVVQLDATTSATTHAIFIVDEAGEIFPGFPLTEVLCGKTNFVPYEKVYAHFPDAFDFLLVMPSGALYDPVEFARRENVPYFVLAKNEVQNIGLPIFDDTAKFGSDGRVRGAVYHSFGSPAIMEHELGHAWGINYGSSLGLVSTTGDGGLNLSHWDEASDISGVMQEFVFADDVVGHLVDNGDGTYRVVPEASDAEAYAPLDLYLMGLIPPEEVPLVHRLIDPDYSDPNRVTADQVETITIQQLMAAEGGPRIPDHTASPKTFTAAFIAISDRPFSQAEYDFFSAMAEYLASEAAPSYWVAPFYAATGGRGTLETRLPSTAPP
jgi:hypothetical protein